MKRILVMSKELVLMRDVICIHHPAFRKSADLRAYGMKHPEWFNGPRLTEESLAAVGNYEFINAHHADFPDGSDCKTGSIGVNLPKGRHNSYVGIISNVATSSGVQKTGALRCIIYNPHKNSLKYYFLPKSMWRNHISINTRGVGYIPYLYHKPRDRIIRFDGYECNSFKELALK